MKYILIPIFTLLALASCKNADPSEGYQSLDLMQYGLPIKVKAPQDAKVESDNFGYVQDVTIKGEDNYYIQIQGGTATTTDVKSIKSGLMSDLKDAKYFSKIIEDGDFGFIYEKDLGDGHLNYDFRYVKVQGDKEFIFQRGMIGQYSLEEVKMMYNSVM